MTKEKFKLTYTPKFTRESKFFVCKTPKLCVYLQQKGYKFVECKPDRKNPFYNVWIFPNSDELYDLVEEYFLNKKMNNNIVG